MTARAYRSHAMVPGVRLIPGWQAGCDSPACGLDTRDVVFLGPVENVTAVWWWGTFQKTFIFAELEATRHNIEKHWSNDVKQGSA